MAVVVSPAAACDVRRNWISGPIFKFENTGRYNGQLRLEVLVVS
jgi:hypothetical protein